MMVYGRIGKDCLKDVQRKESKQVGNHVIELEGENIILFHFGAGAVTGDDVASLVELEKQAWPTGHIYSITSLNDDLSISPGALSRTAKLYQFSPPRTAAFVVRRYYLRTAMEFLSRTLRLLGAKAEIGFFEDEAKAREWIDQKRSERTDA